MGGTDLNDQLLNYYTFLWKSLKWSRKLLIHPFNMVILNAHILNKLYGSEKLSHDAFRDRLIKFFNWRGSKVLQYSFTPSAKKLVNIMKLNFKKKGYMRDIFLLASQLQKGGKGKDQLNLVLCVTNYLYKKLKYQSKKFILVWRLWQPIMHNTFFSNLPHKIRFQERSHQF